MNPLRLGLMVSGRGSNMEAILNEINGGRLAAEAAVVISDNPTARALNLLVETDIPTFVAERSAFRDRESFERVLIGVMIEYRVELVVLAGYMRVLGPTFIEAFSGKSLLTIQQDFYATLFLSNIAAALKADANDIIREDNAAKSLKHEYIANENILIGKLKDKLVLIMLNRDPNKRALLLDRLISQLARNRTPVVPDRHFERPATSHKRAVCRVKRAL